MAVCWRKRATLIKKTPWSRIQELICFSSWVLYTSVCRPLPPSLTAPSCLPSVGHLGQFILYLSLYCPSIWRGPASGSHSRHILLVMLSVSLNRICPYQLSRRLVTWATIGFTFAVFRISPYGLSNYSNEEFSSRSYLVAVPLSFSRPSIRHRIVDLIIVFFSPWRLFHVSGSPWKLPISSPCGRECWRPSVHSSWYLSWWYPCISISVFLSVSHLLPPCPTLFWLYGFHLYVWHDLIIVW